MDYWFDWDDKKEAINIRKHGLDFETAVQVFADPLHQTVQDRIEGGEYRWQTLGQIDGFVVLLVVHTTTEMLNGAHIRIISAREATRREKEQYYGQAYC